MKFYSWEIKQKSKLSNIITGTDGSISFSTKYIKDITTLIVDFTSLEPLPKSEWEILLHQFINHFDFLTNVKEYTIRSKTINLIIENVKTSHIAKLLRNYKEEKEEEKDIITVLKNLGIKGREIADRNPHMLGETPFKMYVLSNALDVKHNVITFTLEVAESGDIYFICDNYMADDYKYTESVLKDLISFLSLDLEYKVYVDKDDPINYVFKDEKNGKQIQENYYLVKHKDIAYKIMKYTKDTLMAVM